MVFTGTKYSFALSTRGSRLVPLPARRSSSRLPYPENCLASHTPSLPGLPLGIQAPITTRATGGSRKRCASSSTRSSSRTPFGARRMGNASLRRSWTNSGACPHYTRVWLRLLILSRSENNIPAMRIGPGKHLKGRKLMGGIITPEEFDHFHEVCTALFPMPV